MKTDSKHIPGLLLLLALLSHAPVAIAGNIDLGAKNLRFEYQEAEPVSGSGSYPCTHAPGPTVRDWRVDCEAEGTVHRFLVHLLLNFYVHPKAVEGGSSYELLYWVGDATDPYKTEFGSTSMWIHNRSKAPEMTSFDISQGVERDLASLRMKVSSK